MSQPNVIRFHVEPPLTPVRALSPFDYNVWRDRILELYEDVYQSPPASWSQLLKDKRNPQQFWTFWIAIAILVLTVVSTMATVVQTVYTGLSYHRR